MKKRNKKHEKRMKKLVVACGLCAILLAVSTYAWFIGMKTVNVSSFDVKIASIDSLLLSLDGSEWKDTVEINSSNFNTASYANNTNSWGGEGLIPMSTVGKINPASSRLTLYEKGSFTETPGGYRIMASEVENTGSTEMDGYVAFDLFIKNLSGNAYYKTLNELNEEAIYLTSDSKVEVAMGGVDNTGIENSVRVAFAQIGRVVATTDNVSTITGITCATAGDVTGICEDRDAQIWEPNDTKHVQNAINWYTKSCLKRKSGTDGADLTKESAYSGSCATIENGYSYPTYAVSGVIDETDQVDVYDGLAYNSYTGSTAASATKGKLMAFDYFTDSEKNLLGTERPTFITLAPNSITKVRVYIYIEGQDVDNYDFASLGKKISVAFGFTKERFYGEDVEYNDSQTATLPDDVIRANHWEEITTKSDN